MSVYVDADKVWEYFIQNKGYLTIAAEMIAENPDYGIEIYIQEHNGLPEVFVEGDGATLYHREILGYYECATVISDVYDRYLTDSAIQAILSLEEMEGVGSEDYYDEDLVADREAELDDAIYDLMGAFAPDSDVDVCSDDELSEGLKDVICEYLWHECGISVFRPMSLVDEEGNEVFEAYPYPYIDPEVIAYG